MSWFSLFVWNPIKALAEGALHAAEVELQHLGVLAAAQIPASPITPAAEAAFETGLQTAMDGVLQGILGAVPVVGAVLSPVAIAEANQALDYLVAKGTKGLNDLARHAKDQLAAAATSPVASGGSANPTAASMAGGS